MEEEKVILIGPGFNRITTVHNKEDLVRWHIRTDDSDEYYVTFIRTKFFMKEKDTKKKGFYPVFSVISLIYEDISYGGGYCFKPGMSPIPLTNSKPEVTED